MTHWHEQRHCEWRSEHAGRVLFLLEGSPTIFCYSDGEYLGSERHMDAARERCVQNRKGDYVMETESIDEQMRRLKVKPQKREWTETSKNTVETTVEGEKLPGRITKLDDRTHAVYRDSRYLGSERTMEDARKRFEINEISQRNAVIRLWEQTHPGELPPGLRLTDAERAEHWRRHPPRAEAAKVTGRGAAPRPDEDPATRKLRAELEADGARGRTGRAKVAAPPRGDAADVPQAGVVRVRAGAAVPKKPGSAAHGRWTLLWKHDGRTVAEYAGAKGNMTTLANAMAKGLVTVETAAAPPPKSEPKLKKGKK